MRHMVINKMFNIHIIASQKKRTGKKERIGTTNKMITILAIKKYFKSNI